MSRSFSRIHDVLNSMAQAPLAWPARYAGAVIVVALCCVLRVQMPATALPYLFFIPGLMLIGFWFGIGPSILGCVLSVLMAQYFFIGPLGFEASLTSWLNSFSFGLVTLGMAVVCALFRRSVNTLYRVNQSLEQEVERRTQERDGIWNVSPDLICTLSELGEVLAMNPAWQAVTGHSEQALKAGAFFDFIAPSQVADALSELQSSSIAELDTEGARDTGEPLHLNWRIAHREGQYYAVARDITLAKERQNALDDVRSQLQQSQKMEAVGQLTGGLAHDFNNLLTVITGSLDMLEQRIERGRFAELGRYMGMAQSAASRAAALTHRLLAYARRQPLVSRAVDPVQLLEDMKELIARTLTPRIELELSTPDAGLCCFCDAHQLENAVLNLCINARDAMPQGGRLRVEVRRAQVTPEQATAVRPAGDYVLIRVADTGTGMPLSVVERAFDPFFTTKPQGVGTGLGLSMVYGFARQSSGDAQIDSVVGAGTAVSLFLPLHQGGADGPRQAPAPNAVGDQQGTGGVALVLDDETAIRDLVAEALEDLGYEVAKSATAADALQSLEALPSLALLVADIDMPGGITGDEVALAALKRYPEVKVLFISGLSETTAPAAAFQAGQMQVLPKPFAIGEFKAVVEHLVQPD